MPPTGPGRSRCASRSRAFLHGMVPRHGHSLADREPAGLAGLDPGGPGQQQGTALVDALEARLGIGDRLDRAPPGVGRRLGAGPRPRCRPSRCRSRWPRRRPPLPSRRARNARRGRRTRPTGCRRRRGGGARAPGPGASRWPRCPGGAAPARRPAAGPGARPRARIVLETRNGWPRAVPARESETCPVARWSTCHSPSRKSPSSASAAVATASGVTSGARKRTRPERRSWSS